MSCFTLLEYKDNNETSTLIASDAQNILSKIDFYFSGTNNVFFPRQNTSCQGSLCVLTVENISPPIQRTISYSDNSLFIAEGGGGQRKLARCAGTAATELNTQNAHLKNSG